VQQQAAVELHPGVDSIKKYVDRAKAQERLKNAEKQRKRVGSSTLPCGGHTLPSLLLHRVSNLCKDCGQSLHSFLPINKRRINKRLMRVHQQAESHLPIVYIAEWQGYGSSRGGGGGTPPPAKLCGLLYKIGTPSFSAG